MDIDHIVNRGRTAFRNRFHGVPGRMATAPGRVNLIGEHVDYMDGLVLPMAIDRWAMFAMAPTLEEESVVRSEDLDCEYRFDAQDLHPVPTNSPSRFANHVIGVLDALDPTGSNPHRAQRSMLVTGNVPMGAGLSSSAALEVAVACGMARELGLELDPLALAQAARHAEHEFVGTPCGIMDMLVSAAAIENHALLIDCRTLETTPIPLPPPDRMAVLVIDTGVKHELATGAYARRRAACERAEGLVGCRLRDADRSMIEAADLDDADRMRALHVVEEIERVRSAVTALNHQDLDRFGEILLAGHASLRDLFEVSCPELDLVVDVVAEMRNDRIHGARMTGGGFGGSAIAILHPAALNEVRDRIATLFMESFGREPRFFTVRPVGGARIVS
ncbi:MAG: galactokinase [Phycisphaerales bacterium]|nr:galactokinase [Phycisphaerales bacterium]